jgi:hypothetical protein
LQRQRAHVSLQADPPGSQVSGALRTLWECYRNSPCRRRKCSSCGTLNEGAELESGGEVKAGVDDGVEDGIDVGVNVGGGSCFCWWT